MNMITPLDAEKVFDKIQQSFMIKVLKEVEIQRIYIDKIETISGKPITNININGEKLKAIPLKSGTRQGFVLFPISIQCSA